MSKSSGWPSRAAHPFASATATTRMFWVAATAVAMLTSVVGPADAQEVSPAPDTSSEASPADDQVVVSNSTIVSLQADVARLVRQLDDVAAGETRGQRRATQARDRLSAADRVVSETEVEADRAGVDLARAETRLDRAQSLLAEARDARDAADEDLAITDVRLEESRRRLQVRVREAWMHGGQLSTNSLALGMDEFNDVARIRHLLGEVVADDNELVADYLRLQLQRTDRLAAATAREAEVATAVDNATASRVARTAAANEATAAADRAVNRRQERAVVLVEVRADLAHLGEERLELERQLDEVQAELDAEIETERQRLDDEQQRRDDAGLSEAEARAADLRAQHQRRIAAAAADDGSPGDARQADVAVPNPGCGSTSLWVWPVDGCVNSPFGFRNHPILDTRRLHAGLDIPAASGTPIHAVADGTVHRAGWSGGGHGNVVVIDHGEVATLYAHQVRVNVTTGQQVVAGQIIGWVGSTGLSTGPHLHLETHVDGPYGTPVDPIRWFR